MSHKKEARHKVENFHGQVCFPSLKRRPDERVVVKTYGHNDGFTPEEAARLVEDIRAFTKVAGQVGINVPRNYLSNVIPDGAPDKRALYFISKAAGKDLGKIIQETNDPEVILDLFTEYLQFYKHVWEDGSRISLDPPPANFCLDKDGNMHYVDVFPPRMVTDDGRTISEMPAPSEETRDFIERRYFGVEQARVIYAQWLRAVHTKNIDPDLLTHHIREILGEHAYQQIHLSPEERDRVLTQPTPTDVDTLRILAGELAARGQMSTQEMKTIFHLCHIVPGGILPQTPQLRIAADLISYAEGRRYLPESSHPQNGEVRQRSAVLLDLDGVVTEYDGSYTPDAETHQHLTDWVAQLEDSGDLVTGLTNRTLARTQEVVQQLGVSSGWWAIENGSVFYNVGTQETLINEKWQEYANDLVPRLRQFLTEAGVVADHEASSANGSLRGIYESSGLVKTVITPVDHLGQPLPREEFFGYADDVILPALRKSGLIEYFTLHIGKAIDLDPVDLNKVDGIVPLLKLNPGTSFDQTLFIADAPRDIEVARVIKDLGGEAAAVANGRAEFLDAISEIDGIIAPNETDHITSVLAIHQLYLSQQQEVAHE